MTLEPANRSAAFEVSVDDETQGGRHVRPYGELDSARCHKSYLQRSDDRARQDEHESGVCGRFPGGFPAWSLWPPPELGKPMVAGSNPVPATRSSLLSFPAGVRKS